MIPRTFLSYRLCQKMCVQCLRHKQISLVLYASYKFQTDQMENKHLNSCC